MHPAPIRLIVLPALAAAALSPVAASAQIGFGIGVGPPPDRVIESRRPVRGYSGFVRYGGRQYYCDYVRYPNHVCGIDRAGRERCRVAGWRTVQQCR